MFKRLLPVLVTCVVAAAVVTGCSKSSTSDQGASATASAGPVTDSGSTGLKPQAGNEEVAGDAAHGSQIFSQNCASCHGADGSGGGIGTKLVGEKSRKSYEATVAWIKSPQPPMPKLYPAPLSEKDVDDVAAYVQHL